MHSKLMLQKFPKMSRLPLYTIIILMGSYFCKTQSNNSLIQVPSITATNEECGTKAILEEAKITTKVALSLYYPTNPANMPATTRPVLKTEYYGHTQGFLWDDIISSHQPTIIGIQHVNIFYGNQINSIQVTYLLADGTLYNATRHGRSVGYNVSITLNEDEHLVRIQGMESASSITQLIFISKNSSGIEVKYGPFGGTGETSFSVEGYIIGFRGYASTAIHGLSAYYLSPLRKSNETFGASSRTSIVDDSVNTIIPPVIGIKNITIYHGTLIDSIQCDYILLGGSILEGNRVGGNGGHRSTVTLENDEVLYRLVAKTSGTYVDQLILYTTQQNYSTMHGPYGTGGGNLSEFSGAILGIYGFLEYFHKIGDDVVSSIGVYTL